MPEMRLRPGPGETYSAPQTPSWISGGLLLREGEKGGREGWEGRGRKEKGGRGREGEERAQREGEGGRFDPHFSLPSTAPAYNDKP